jgi:hypothetical protein
MALKTHQFTPWARIYDAYDAEDEGISEVELLLYVPYFTLKNFGMCYLCFAFILIVLG